jgi:hypothetical protein
MIVSSCSVSAVPDGTTITDQPSSARCDTHRTVIEIAPLDEEELRRRRDEAERALAGVPVLWKPAP